MGMSNKLDMQKIIMYDLWRHLVFNSGLFVKHLSAYDIENWNLDGIISRNNGMLKYEILFLTAGTHTHKYCINLYNIFEVSHTCTHTHAHAYMAEKEEKKNM